MYLPFQVGMFWTASGQRVPSTTSILWLPHIMLIWRFITNSLIQFDLLHLHLPPTLRVELTSTPTYNFVACTGTLPFLHEKSNLDNQSHTKNSVLQSFKHPNIPPPPRSNIRWQTDKQKKAVAFLLMTIRGQLFVRSDAIKYIMHHTNYLFISLKFHA